MTHPQARSWRSCSVSRRSAERSSTSPSGLVCRIAREPLLNQREHSAAIVDHSTPTHVAGVRCRAIGSLRSDDRRVPHDLRHHRVLRDHQSRPIDRSCLIQQGLTDFKVGEPPSLPTGETLELAPAQPEVPQPQRLCAAFQRFQNRRDGRPSFARISGDLRMVQLLRGQNIFLSPLSVLAYVPMEVQGDPTSMNEMSVTKTLFARSENRGPT